MDSEVRSQIVQGCLSERLKARAMEESTWTLDQVVAQGRLIESIEAQIKGMKPGAINQREELYQIGRSQAQKSSNGYENRSRMLGAKRDFSANKEAANRFVSFAARDSKTTCYRCGGEYPHKNISPAKDKRCHACNGLNHFESCCKTKWRAKQKEEALNGIYQENPVDNTNFTDHFWSLSNNNKAIPKTRIRVRNTDLEFGIDTGATVNVMDFVTYKKLLNPPHLFQSDIKLYPYGATMPLDMAGKFKTRILYNNQPKDVEFHVTNGCYDSIIGNCIRSWNS